jgi:hypothetical protein
MIGDFRIMNSKLLKYSLLFGCFYFVCMALAHFFSVKVPILFVYYDTEFYGYQDKIISFAVTAYVALFYLASKERKNVPAAIVVLGLTTLGLSFINFSNDLKQVMTSGQATLPYWLQTAFIGSYFLTLLLLYVRDGKSIRK